jgi:hypothetical protein
MLESAYHHRWGVRGLEGQVKGGRSRKRMLLGIALLLVGIVLIFGGISLYNIWEDNPYDELEGGGSFYHGNRPYGAQGQLAIVVGAVASAGGLFLVFTKSRRWGSGLLGKLSEPAHMEELRDYLQLNGYPAKVIDKHGPEAIHHNIPLAGNDPLTFPRMGVVKVEGHHLEYVEVIRMFPRSRGPMIRVSYFYVCAMRAEVGRLEKELSATTSYQDNADPRSSGLVWQGGWLARILNADGELRTLLEESGSPTLIIRADPRDNYVAVIKDSSRTVRSAGIMVKYGKLDYPTPQDLAIIDHIFQMVKESMADWKADLDAKVIGSDGIPLSDQKVSRITPTSWFATGVLLLLLFSFSSVILSLWVSIPLTLIAAAGMIYLQMR